MKWSPALVQGINFSLYLLVTFIFLDTLTEFLVGADPNNLVQSKQFKFINGKLFSRTSETERRGVKEVDVYWFTQTLDHFNSKDTRKWKQRFFVNKNYFQPGGPVFLIIGGENEVLQSSLKFGAYVDYAKQVGALLFTLEHRYYGESRPTDDTSVENLQFLSSRQALKDLELFVKGMKSKDNLKNNTWITLGGSYSGSLAAWFRLKHPDLVYAAVASSAPLDAVMDFTAYYDVVRGSVISKGSSDCVTEIGKATEAISEILSSRLPVRLTALKNMFRLCDRVDVRNDLDKWGLYERLAGNFAAVVQYNEIHTAGGNSGISNISISKLCDLMIQKGAPPLEKYAAVNDLLMDKVYKEKCNDVSYTSTTAYMKTESWNSSAVQLSARQWLYQTCSEFGFFQTSEGRDEEVFGPFPLHFSTQNCEDVFGMKFNKNFLSKATDSTNEFYGRKNIHVRRVIFVNGSIDPWNALGIISNSSTAASLDSDNLVLYIKGAAHCSDYYSQTSRDSPQLIQTRQKILQKLKEWIAD